MYAPPSATPGTGYVANYYDGGPASATFDVYPVGGVPQGGYVQLAITGTNAPTNAGFWEVRYNGQVIATDASPAGWDINGWGASTTIFVPMTAAVGSGYELRILVGSGPESAPFSVIADRFQPQTGTRYLTMPNGARVPVTPTGIPTASTPHVACTIPNSPMAATWDYDGTSLGHYTFTFRDGTKWVMTNCTQTLPPGGGYLFESLDYECFYALSQIVDRNNNALDLNYSGVSYAGSPLLASFSDHSTGATLLTINRSSSSYVQSVSDANGRSVYYQYDYLQCTNDSNFLIQTDVSQVVATGTASPPYRWHYTYVTKLGAPGINTITIPSPTGTGTSTATINYYDPVAGSPSTIYASGGTVRSLVDANGVTTSFLGLDASHTQVTVTDAANNTVATRIYGFDNNMSQTSVTDDASNVLENTTYDDTLNPHRPTSVSDVTGHSLQMTWDSHGNLVTAVSARGTTTTNTWDYTGNSFPFGRLTSVQEGSKAATSFTYYEPSGLVNTATGPSPTGTGTVTSTFSYSSLGNVTQVVAPGNNAASTITTTLNYTTDGSYTQDERLGEPLTVTDNLGHTSHARYDARGNTVLTADALGNEYDSTYNLANQPLTTSSPATGQTGTGHGYSQNAYLYMGGPLASTTLFDESGTQVRQVTHAYGLEGEHLSTTGSTEPVANTYDALYRVHTLTDGNSHQTNYTYNAEGYLSQVALPGGDTVQFPNYDANGRLLKRIDGNGVEIDYSYSDVAGALSDIQYPASTSLNAHFVYDSYGRPSSRTDGTGSQSYSYGDLNQLFSVTTTYTGLAAKTISYSYYANGQRSAMGTPAGTFSYAYDAAGRPASLTNPFSETTAWQWQDNDWLQSQTLANGVVSSYTLDPLGRLTDLLNALGTGTGATTLSEFGVPATSGYDGASNRLSVAASLPGAPAAYSGTTTYQYDIKDQLTQEQSTRSGSYTNGFAYDSAGNPTTLRSQTGYTYNAKNQLTGGTSLGTFTYDGNGNPTTYNGTTLGFDPNNKLTSVGTTLSAGYTIDGLRAWKQNTATSTYTYYLYDGTTPVVELNASGSVTATNTFGANGLISRNTTGASSGSVYYAFDERGNTAQRIDASGTVLSAHLADSFGLTQSTLTGSTDPFDGFGAQYGYYTDHETGLVLCTNRYYDPANARWITRDPIGYRGGINLYNYVTNNPIMGIDPSGLCSGLSSLPSLSSSGGAGVAGYGTGDLPPFVVLPAPPDPELAAFSPTANWNNLVDRVDAHPWEFAIWAATSLLPMGGEVSGTEAAVEGAEAGGFFGADTSGWTQMTEDNFTWYHYSVDGNVTGLGGTAEHPRTYLTSFDAQGTGPNRMKPHRSKLRGIPMIRSLK